jgi:uncharacterized protein YyaL (SSP411 family)
LLKPAGQAGERISALAPFVKDLQTINTETAVYLCERHDCEQNPITEVEQIEAALA